jgi:uncharacterized protein (TIGR02246 family)
MAHKEVEMSTQSLTSEDLEAVQSIFDRVPQYLASNDFQSWSELFDEDAILMPPNAPRVQGRAAIRAFGESLPKMIAITFYDVEIEGQGDFAVGRSAIRQTIQLDGAGEVNDTAKQLAVMQKQADGTWLVTTVMYSSDLPIG